MPIFSGKQPSKGEVRAFGRGKQSSAKAAEQYAAKKARQADFAAQKRAAAKRRSR